jgi:hypothetical protein
MSSYLKSLWTLEMVDSAPPGKLQLRADILELVIIEWLGYAEAIQPLTSAVLILHTAEIATASSTHTAVSSTRIAI